MMSEALELDGGRVSHSLRMGVVMAMVGAGMVNSIHAGEIKGAGRMSGDAGAHQECEVKILMTPNHTAVQVRISGLGQAGIGRSS